MQNETKNFQIDNFNSNQCDNQRNNQFKVNERERRRTCTAVAKYSEDT